MPQISLYVTQPDLAKIENAAAKEKKSISKWVVTKIFEYLEPSYPAGYEKLAAYAMKISGVRIRAIFQKMHTEK